MEGLVAARCATALAETTSLSGGWQVDHGNHDVVAVPQRVLGQLHHGYQVADTSDGSSMNIPYYC
jgi:hypothetical protein